MEARIGDLDAALVLEKKNVKRLEEHLNCNNEQIDLQELLKLAQIEATCSRLTEEREKRLGYKIKDLQFKAGPEFMRRNVEASAQIAAVRRTAHRVREKKLIFPCCVSFNKLLSPTPLLIVPAT